MKQIIFTDSNIIPFEKIKEQTRFPIVGFQTEEGNHEKGMLVNENFNSTLYFARCLDGWEEGNGWDIHGKDIQTIEEWMAFFIKTRKAVFYLFDSPKELFKWLAE